MNEVQELVEAFDAAQARSERCALATIVSVEGSSYRYPGARMLVSETGSSTGTISAGCLESDVIEHAKGVIRVDRSKLIEYDTATTGDEMAWGLGIGCGGIVRVLVEPVSADSPYIEALRRSLTPQADAVPLTVATVYHCAPSGLVPSPASLIVGSRLFIDQEGRLSKDKLSDQTAAMLEPEVRSLIAGGLTCTADIEVVGVTAGVFVETLLPPISLVVFGAGSDALPVVELARELGWRTEVVDPQARPATRSRFAVADRVTLVRPEDIPAQVSITPLTITLLMSHNYSYDLEMLGFVLRSPARYIGVMGPRQRTERMLAELRASKATIDRLYAPAGLDIGANGPREIALSIIAEMRAVVDGRCGGMLRERQGAIHGSPGERESVSSREDRVLSIVAA
jgi:xanthine/CO dehydrogenase XdhC/CoxF family maturation factor